MDAKPTLYGETSFWARVFDRDDPVRRRLTRRFLKWARGQYSLRTSALVRQEVRRTRNREVRRAVERYLRRARPRVVPTTGKMWELAGEIHRRMGRGAKGFADSVHLAYAVVVKARAMVTWDAADLGREWARRVVREVCEERGLPVPMVGTPKEVMEWASRGIV